MPKGGYRPRSGPMPLKPARKPAARSRSKTPRPALSADERAELAAQTAAIVAEIGIGGKATPLEYMLAVMQDPTADALRRDRMAIAAAPYVHPRAGETGKKALEAMAEHDAEK